MRRILSILFILLIPVFLLGVYLAILFKQVETSFQTKAQWIPTRIYSDVTKLSAGEMYSDVKQRLSALGYSFTESNHEITFSLHPIRYPDALIPTDHPSWELAEKQTLIRLEFSGSKAGSELEAIRVQDQEISDVFLEPEFIGTLTSEGGNVNRQVREWLALAEIPPAIWKAILAIEDQHFLEHIGLDWRGLARAIWVNLRQLRLAQGGSTITQQLVKNLMERHDKDLFKKANEVLLAILLEIRFSKEEILERYLNEVYLGQIGNLEIHGVAEGAKYFFGKRIQEIDLHEAALMAALIKGPNYYSPYRYRQRAIERQQLVLRKMQETGHIALAELKQSLSKELKFAPPQVSTNNKAPYFLDFVKAELESKLAEKYDPKKIPDLGLRVYTTLDPKMNQIAQRAVITGITRLQSQLKIAQTQPNQRLEGALAAVDHSTGSIRALIGGRNYAESNFNRILNMRRQVGSTFKPILFLAAIQKRRDEQGIPIGPAYPIEDAPFTLTFDRGKQKWSPKNYDPDYRGWITMREALAHSINTATARLGHEVGPREIINTARALGISSDLPEVPSLSLGVAELSPVELLKAYAAFANHGQADELTVIRAVTEENGDLVARFVYNPKWVADPASVDLLTDLMKSVFSDGTASVAKTWGWDRPAAGKTGTTSLHRDSWFAGFTPQLTAVVWVGWDQVAPENKKLPKLTGAVAALPIWVDFMKEAEKSVNSTPFSKSPHLVEVRIDKKTGLRATAGCSAAQVTIEPYIQGNEPSEESCADEYPPSSSQAKED